jgi:hypothetical protein
MVLFPFRCRHFGFFVDIGSVVDGLVHIGDISPMFFTRAVQNRVKRGQKITVWVKDVDPIRNRIRLRMYPINSAIKYRWSGLKVGQEVNGTVSKIADDALYVDIGAPMLGYLPRRNMKIPKGKGNYLVHEIAPYNSTVRCFIREVNDKLRRLTVTTYLPENWHIYLPPLPTEEVIKSEARPYKGRFAEQEELKRQKQLEREAFKRRMRGETAGPNQYETDDDVDDDQMSDNDGFSTAESLSDEEIEQLSNQRPVLFDDLRGDSVPIKLTRGQRQRIQAAADGGDRQLTTKQLFKMLCDGKDYITFKDFKHWWYVQVLKQAGDWDGRKFKEVMAEASGGYLRVYESQLDRFLIIFARKFGIKTGRDDEVPDEKDAEGFEGDVKQTEIDEVNLKTAHPDVEEDARALLQEEGLGHRKDEYDFSISDIDSIGGLTEADAKWMLCEEMRVDKSAEVNLDEFKSMLSTPRSRTLKWDQVKEWKLSRLVLAAKIVTAAELKDIFHAGNNDRISMNEIQFQQYVHTLRCVLQDRLFSSLQEAPTDVVQFKSILPVSPPVQSNIQVSTDNLTAIIERMDQDLAHSKQHDGALESNIIEDGTGESIEYDQLMSKLFAKLSKGKSFILFEDLLQWEMVQDLMEMVSKRRFFFMRNLIVDIFLLQKGKVDTDYLKEMVKLLNQVENQNDEEENIESAIFSSSRLEIDIEKFKTIVTMLVSRLCKVFLNSQD